MKTPHSLESAVTRSPVCRIVRTNSPCVVPNPVRTTTQTQPRSGGLPTLTPAPGLNSALSTLVPANNTCVLSIVLTSSRPTLLPVDLAASIACLRWGVDSPVNIASVLIASPCDTQNTTSITLVAHTSTRVEINSPQSEPSLPGQPPPRPFRSSRSQ